MIPAFCLFMDMNAAAYRIIHTESGVRIKFGYGADALLCTRRFWRLGLCGCF